jgi:hypothetical protein
MVRILCHHADRKISHRWQIWEAGRAGKCSLIFPTPLHPWHDNPLILLRHPSTPLPVVIGIQPIPETCPTWSRDYIDLNCLRGGTWVGRGC